MAAPIDDHAHKEIGVLLEPILAVFGGEDGGVAFAKLRHGFLPEIWVKAHGASVADGGQKASDLLTMVEQFSKLCQVMMKK